MFDDPVEALASGVGQAGLDGQDERGEVSAGLRRVIVIQAVRLADLAARRLAYAEGRKRPDPEAIDVPALVGNVMKEFGDD